MFAAKTTFVADQFRNFSFVSLQLRKYPALFDQIETVRDNKYIRRMDEFLGMAAVMRLCGLSRQEIWRRRRAGQFPEACRLGARRIGFLKSEIEAWQKARRQERDAMVEARRDAVT